ncbi:unnamed protein product, partial [Staurois parvus]
MGPPINPRALRQCPSFQMVSPPLIVNDDAEEPPQQKKGGQSRGWTSGVYYCFNVQYSSNIIY